MRGSDGIDRSDRVVWQAASVVLGYPDDEVVDRAELVRAALADAARQRSADFASLWDFWGDHRARHGAEPLRRDLRPLPTAHAVSVVLHRRGHPPTR